MDLVDMFNEIPFTSLFGIEVTDATDGRAAGTMAFSEDLLSNPNGEVLHGGATYALADTVGGAAVVSETREVAPTVDMRIDYLAPATTALRCDAEVIRSGEHLAMVRADVVDAEDVHVATAQGTYKTGGQGEATPWGEDPRASTD